mgnify:CR=1 FL=1|jgi:hypothetical protein
MPGVGIFICSVFRKLYQENGIKTLYRNGRAVYKFYTTTYTEEGYGWTLGALKGLSHDTLLRDQVPTACIAELIIRVEQIKRYTNSDYTGLIDM